MYAPYLSPFMFISRTYVPFRFFSNIYIYFFIKMKNDEMWIWWMVFYMPFGIIIILRTTILCFDNPELSICTLYLASMFLELYNYPNSYQSIAKMDGRGNARHHDLVRDIITKPSMSSLMIWAFLAIRSRSQKSFDRWISFMYRTGPYVPEERYSGRRMSLLW
jgi:hypothetical protein